MILASRMERESEVATPHLIKGRVLLPFLLRGKVAEDKMAIAGCLVLFFSLLS